MVSVGRVGVAVEVDDGDGDWRQRDAERARVCWCECGSEYGRRSCGLSQRGDEWLVRSLARQVCAKARQGGRSGQPTSSSRASSSKALQLPKGTPYMKRPSTPSANRHLLRPGHGESNRRRTLQVGTRDVAAKICPSTALPCSTAAAAIPGFNPATRSTGSMADGGVGKLVSIFVCCGHACIYSSTFSKLYPLQCARTHSTLPHL